MRTKLILVLSAFLLFAVIVNHANTQSLPPYKNPNLPIEQRVDALTAMGTSVAVVGKNLPVMLTWGVIVLGLFILSLATGLLGLIIVFPVLGHGTWHAYQALKPVVTA